MQSGKDQDSYIKPPVKMLARDLTEKYVREIVRDAARRALASKEKANKLDQAWKGVSEQEKEKYLGELNEKIADKIQNVSTDEQEILKNVGDILARDLDPAKIQNLSHKPGDNGKPPARKAGEEDDGRPWWKWILRSYWAKGLFGLIFIGIVAYLALNMLFPAKLYLNTTSLDFGTIGEGSPSTLGFSIDNPGKVALTWSVDTDQPWIAVTPSYGTNAGVVQVSVVQGSLEPGDQRGIVNVRSNAGDQQIKVSLHAQTPAKPDTYPEYLDFVKIGRMQPSRQMLSVSNSGEIPLRWTASANVSWIALSGNRGTNNGDIGVDIIGYQAPGNYHGSIAIRSNDGMLEIPVSLDVRKPPQLTVFPNPLDFEFEVPFGGNVSLPNPKNMTIRNDGGAALNWKISDDSWLTVDPSSGSTQPGKEQMIKVGIKPDLEQIDYSGNISISSNGGNATGTVKLKRIEMMMSVAAPLLSKRLMADLIPIVSAPPSYSASPSNSTPQPAKLY